MKSTKLYPHISQGINCILQPRRNFLQHTYHQDGNLLPLAASLERHQVCTYGVRLVSALPRTRKTLHFIP